MNVTEGSLARIFVIFCVMFCLQMVCLAEQSNLVANADVESGSPASWSTSVAQGTIVAQSWATDRSVSGTHSLKSVMSNDGTAHWGQYFPNIDATVTYRLRAHIYASNVTTDSHGVEIQWYNGDQYLTRNFIYSNVANSWSEVKAFNIAPPANATSAYLILRTYKTGSYYFDDIAFMPADIGQSNLIANTDVESADNYSTPVSWSTSVAQGTIVAQSWATDRSVSGTHSLKSVMSNDGTAHWGQYFPNIDATVTYRLRAHIYASNVTTDSHGVEIQWYNGGQYLTRNFIYSNVANSWVEAKAFNIIPPANATSAYLILRTYKAGSYYFDDIAFVREDKDLIKINGEIPIGLYHLPAVQSLTNPDMEYTDGSGNGMYPFGWYTEVGSGTAAHAWDLTNYFSGTRSVKITMTTAGQADWRQKTANIKAGDSYTLDAAIYATNVSSGSHSVEVQWFSANDGYLGRSYIFASSANSWSSVTSGSITAPAGASYAWIFCRAYSIGVYNFDMVKLTKNISLTDRFSDAYNAGFNYLCSYGDSGLLSSISSSGVGLKTAYWPNNLMSVPDMTALVSEVTGVSNSSSLSLWLGPDEPNYWFSSAIVTEGLTIVKNNDSYYNTVPHSIWLNFAPFGIPSAPTDFTTLKPFCTATDIVSMDIYPVPDGVGHSVLADQTISCVGKYVDTLYNHVVSNNGTQRQPIWMVLQGGFNWGPSSSIELHWVGSNGYISRYTYQPASAGSWQEIAISNIVPPAGATEACVVARTYYNGTYYFDDIYFSTNGVNLLSNSNMETGSPANWVTSSAGGASTQTWDTGTYHSSNHSLKTVMNGFGYTHWGQSVSGINPAQTYSLSAWVNASNLQMPLPTWTQTRFMAYNAIIHGARGIVYYDPGMATIDSGAWDDLKNIASEIHSLSNALTSYISFRKVTASNANIETLLMEYNGNLYLLAANTSSSSTGNVTFTISGLPLSSSTEFFQSRQLTVSSNQFTENTAFSGYQVHVYSIH